MVRELSIYLCTVSKCMYKNLVHKLFNIRTNIAKEFAGMFWRATEYIELDTVDFLGISV